MRFDPQANMVSGASNHSGRNAPKGGLRAGMLIVIIAMAGAFGTWIYKQVDLGPAGASAATSFGAAGVPRNESDKWSGDGTSSPKQPPPAARRSNVNHDAVRRAAPTKQTAASDVQSQSKSKPQQQQSSVVVKDSKRRFAVIAYAEGDKALSAGQHIQAIIAFDKAIELDPGYTDAYYALGLAYIMAGDRRAAIEQLRRLREMDENLANLLANLLE